MSERIDVDFNNDGKRDGRDVSDFLAAVGGTQVPGADSLDVNGDGVFPDDADTAAFFNAFAASTGPDTLLAMPTDFGRVVYVPGEGQEPNPLYRNATTIGEAMRMLGREGWKTCGTIMLGPGDHRDYIGGGWTHDKCDYGGKPDNPLIICTDPASRRRARLILPSNVGRGVRIGDDCSNITIRGIQFVCTNGQSAVHIAGTARDIAIVDCIIDGGGTGIAVEGSNVGGVDKRPTRITLAYNMILRVSAPQHTQGIYASNYSDLRIWSNLLWECGKLGNPFDQGIYLVHNAKACASVLGNLIGRPGSAVMQFRGGQRSEFAYNVGFWFNTGGGFGHPMGYADGVLSDADVHDNLFADARTDATAPAQWGISHMAGKVNRFRANIIAGVARPWMTGQDQGGGAERVPVGDFIITPDNITRPEQTGIDWFAELAQRLSREYGEWEEAIHGTRGLIERMR